MDDYFPEYGVAKNLKYPKAGGANSAVKVGVFHLEQEKTVWIDLGKEKDVYIPRIQWTNDPAKLSLQRLNRLQNNLELMLADVETGNSKTILTETNPAWVDVDNDLTLLEEKDQFIWTSERDGFKHIYLYDLSGKLISQLTEGKWEVGRIYSVDEKDKKVFFSANKEHVTQNHVFSVKLDGKSLKNLSKGQGSHRANFSPNNKSFIHTYSNLTTPTKYELVSSKGKVIRVLEENIIAALDEYEISYPEM